MTTPEQATYHVAPLVALVRHKLHPGTTLAERVRKLRYRRRRAVQAVDAASTPTTTAEAPQ